MPQRSVSPSLRPPAGPARRALRRLGRLDIETAWLDHAPRWGAGRLRWPGRPGALPPARAELERAAAALRRAATLAALARPWAAVAWPERRLVALERAAALAALAPADLVELERAARAGVPGAVAALAAWLAAEALCPTPLPLSPAAALLGCPGAPAALRAVIADDGRHPAARTLAALALGALDRRRAAGGPAAGCAEAYAHGRIYGLPAAAYPTVAMLLAPDGGELARRVAAAARRAGPFGLPGELQRELLADGHSLVCLAELAEAAARAAPLAEALIRRGEQASARARRRRAAARAHAWWRDRLGRLALLLPRYLRAGDPAAVAPFCRFVELMLELAGPPAPLLGAALAVLEDGASLAPPLRRAYLELLVAEHAQLWPRAELAVGAAALEPWLADCASGGALRVRAILARCGDARVARTAVALGCHRVVAIYGLDDPAGYPWMLAQLQVFPQAAAAAGRLFALAQRYRTAADMRAAIGPLVAAVASAPAAERMRLLDQAVAGLRREGLVRPADVARLARHLPQIGCVAGGAPAWAWAVVGGLVALDRIDPELAAQRLAGLLDALSRPGRPQVEAPMLRVGLRLAVAVAAADQARFLEVALTIARRELAPGFERCLEGVAVLARMPALCEAAAALAVQQPQRLLRLLVDLARTRQLGPQALEPLVGLAPAASGSLDRPALHSDQPDWRALLALVPAAEGHAAAYLHARWVIGAPLDLPPGVRRALDQPRRMADEAAHLAGLVAAQPRQPALAARLAALRARLADPAPLWEQALAEAAARLAQVTAEAQLAAAEALLNERYRERLIALTGPLPLGQPLDDDMRNAVLLSVDIRPNRRLLRRLLQAHIAGEVGWREALPANAAFLSGLDERGLSREAWLGAWPASQPCPALPGGRLRMELERSPLRILQMGNLFGTCLSLGSFNAFSAVANAVDLNKRVLYAYDGGGRVVGRKLVGMSADGRLLGYATYTSASGEPQAAAIEAAILGYLRGFAARCGLELADAGVLPQLVCEEWYDDGAQAWPSDEPAGLGR